MESVIQRGIFYLLGGIAADILFTVFIFRLNEGVDRESLLTASRLVGFLVAIGPWVYHESYIHRLLTGKGQPLPLCKVVAYLERRLDVSFRDIEQYRQSSGLMDSKLKLADGTTLKQDLPAWEAFSAANECLAAVGREVAVHTKAPKSDGSPAPEVEAQLRELVSRFEELVEDKAKLCRALPQLFDGLLRDELEPLLNRCPAELRKGVVDVVLKHYSQTELAAWCHDCLHDARLVGFDCNGYFTPVSNISKMLTEKLAVGETTEMWVASAKEFLSGAGFVLWCGRLEEACQELDGPGSEQLKECAWEAGWPSVVVALTDFQEHHEYEEHEAPGWRRVLELPPLAAAEQLELYRQLKQVALLPKEQWEREPPQPYPPFELVPVGMELEEATAPAEVTADDAWTILEQVT